MFGMHCVPSKCKMLSKEWIELRLNPVPATENSREVAGFDYSDNCT